MCDCRSNTEARLLEKVKTQIPANASGLTVELDGYAFILGGPEGVKMKNAMPVKIEYKAPNRKDEIKTKKQTINMTGNYCMFCGEKYDA